MRRHSALFSFIFLATFLTSCAGTTGSAALDSGLIGGVAGTALGAGTGALIGEAMSNGDVEESALLGGAIGLVSGIAIGAAVHHYQEQSLIDGNDAQIQSNMEYLQSSQREIDGLRENLEADSYAIQPDESRREYLYDGATVGQYRR